MTEVAEGKQIPINTATKKQLRDFANHLGCVTTNFDTEDALRAKIRKEGYEEAHIIAISPAPKAPKAPAAKAGAPSAAKASAVITEPMVDLTIHTQEGPGGKRHVFVGVNGTAILIPRNKRVTVKLRYLGALEDAIETKYEYDEDAKANVPRDMPSYPFQVHSQPSEDEKARWYAYEAAEEAKARRRERAPVPVYDAAEAD